MRRPRMFLEWVVEWPHLGRAGTVGSVLDFYERGVVWDWMVTWTRTGHCTRE